MKGWRKGAAGEQCGELSLKELTWDSLGYRLGRSSLKQAQGSPECHKEAPFSVLDEREGVPTVLTGVIDLVHRTEDGWKIVDYKTDRDAAALPAKYAGQIANYERAWRVFVPETVASVLVSTRVQETW